MSKIDFKTDSIQPLILNLILILLVFLESEKHIGVISAFGLLIFLLSFLCLLNQNPSIKACISSLCVVSLSIWVIIVFYRLPVLETGLLGVLLYSILPVSYLVARILFREESKLLIFCRTNALFCIVNLLIGIYQASAGQAMTGLFIQPNTFSAFLNISLLPLLFVWLFNKDQIDKKLDLPLILSVLIITLILTGSRGGNLSFVLILFTLSAAFYRLVNIKRSVYVVMLLIVTTVLTARIDNLSFASRMQQTVESVSLNQSTNDLVTQDSSLNERVVIWEKAWQQILQNPWSGYGPLSFLLKYPAFSPVADTSTRQYVHNDYIQYWFELGVPGLILILCLPFYMAYILIRSMNVISVVEKGLIVGIVAAVLSICLHSLVSYNFYVVPILIMIGVSLGYLDNTMMKADVIKTISITINENIYKYFILITTLCLILLSISMLSMHYSLAKARQALVEGDIATSEKWSGRSISFLETSANQYVRALAYIEAIEKLNANEESDKRQQLYKWSVEALSRAITLNPYSSDARYGLARLYSVSPGLTGEDWQQKSAFEFKLALALDPRYLFARIEYADLLDQSGYPAFAWEVLEQGSRYQYPLSKTTIDYMKLLARYRKQQGDINGARLLRRKANRLGNSLENNITE